MKHTFEDFICDGCEPDPRLENWRTRTNPCTCTMRPVRATDIDPPDVKIDKWCPVHGMDPDEEYEKRRDRARED